MTIWELIEKYGTREATALAFLQGKMPPEDEECVVSKFDRLSMAVLAARHLSLTAENFQKALHKFVGI